LLNYSPLSFAYFLFPWWVRPPLGQT